jgi:hypothetical protein
MGSETYEDYNELGESVSSGVSFGSDSKPDAGENSKYFVSATTDAQGRFAF